MRVRPAATILTLAVVAVACSTVFADSPHARLTVSADVPRRCTVATGASVEVRCTRTQGAAVQPAVDRSIRSLGSVAPSGGDGTSRVSRPDTARLPPRLVSIQF